MVFNPFCTITLSIFFSAILLQLFTLFFVPQRIKNKKPIVEDLHSHVKVESPTTRNVDDQYIFEVSTVEHFESSKTLSNMHLSRISCFITREPLSSSIFPTTYFSYYAPHVFNCSSTPFRSHIILTRLKSLTMVTSLAVLTYNKE